MRNRQEQDDKKMNEKCNESFNNLKNRSRVEMENNNELITQSRNGDDKSRSNESEKYKQKQELDKLIMKQYRSDMVNDDEVQMKRRVKQLSWSGNDCMNRHRTKEEQIEQLVNKYQSILNSSLQIIRRINENDLKTFREIQGLLKNKQNIKEFIFVNDQQLTQKVSKADIKSRMVIQKQTIKQYNLYQLELKKNHQFIKELDHFIKNLQELIKNKQHNKFQQTQISITKSQLDFYNNFKKFQENIDDLSKKCRNPSDKEYVKYLNKYRNLLYEWEKYKIVLGNYENIFKDKVIWDRIKQFEHQIGEINQLNQNTRNVANGLSTVINQISHQIITKREELKLGI